LISKKKSSPLKQPGQMIQNLVGSVLGRSKFRFIWTSGFRGEDFFKSANQKQELPLAAMFANGSGRNEQTCSKTLNYCIFKEMFII
jgi:hypothetical protein